MEALEVVEPELRIERPGSFSTSVSCAQRIGLSNQPVSASPGHTVARGALSAGRLGAWQEGRHQAGESAGAGGHFEKIPARQGSGHAEIVH